jgi:hypothetical protein
MANVKIIAEFFLISLAWTLTLFSPIASSKLTGNGFIKLISNLAMGSLVLTLIMYFVSGGEFSSLGFILKIIPLLSLILISVFHKDDKSFFMWLLYALVVGTLAIHIVAYSPVLPSALFLFSSALLLGIITYSMVLGHWYLVVPKLSEQPLKIAALITWVILGLKIISSLYYTYKNVGFFEEQTTLGSGYAFNWLLLLMRMSFGYLVILGMSIFNWKLVKIRSIQSSTGILYAMTFFIFIGELISTFMFFNFGLRI